MISITRSLLVLATAGVAAVPMAVRLPSGRVAADPGVDPTQVYSKSQKEYYLTSEQIQFIRPGLGITVDSITIPADRHPVVELSYVDDFGQPLDRAGVQTPGEISFSFILAWYDATNVDYHAYTTRPQTSPITGVTAVQASADSGGTYTDLGLGKLRYRFGTELPADYQTSVTTTLGIYAEREIADLPGIDEPLVYYANVEPDFVPDGSEVTDSWGALLQSSCNACHNQLEAHGGVRRDVKLCVLCHNSQTFDPDTGNTVDFKVMIHKIHRGADLPSVQAGTPYQIIGYRQSVHDYSDVVFPQDIRNCTTCHAEDAPQGYIWYTDPNRAACGSCHDNVDFMTGEGHHGVAQESDEYCSRCHMPDSGAEFDPSIVGAHVVPTQSKQLAGLNMTIDEVTDTAPGAHPTVIFRLTNNDGTPVLPSDLDRLSIHMAGPTTDYEQVFSESATGAVVSGDVYMYTFTEPVPDNAVGTWAFSADAYRFVTLYPGTDDEQEVREAAFNPIYYAAVTDPEPVPRREVVALDKCNVCHKELALHGGQRKNVEECLLCHNPLATDEEVRPEDQMPPTGIQFKWMIHRIHAGSTLDVDYTVYGYRSSVNNYNDVVFPGLLNDCATCHMDETYTVPVPSDALPTTAPRNYYSPVPPNSAACEACHSSVAAAAHAYSNTTPFGEACAACHGNDREFSVDAVHAE